MSSLPRRQNTVKPDAAARRTPAGEALTLLLVQVIRLAELFTQTGEALAKREGQTLARWLVLETLEHGAVPVAEIARRLRLARQSVQRVADLLERDGLIAYQPNPQHRRAKLASLTPHGRDVLERIQPRQRGWANRHGALVGAADLDQARELLRRIHKTLSGTDDR
jgi:DNA-binding MarR family transcriptional regulator